MHGRENRRPSALRGQRQADQVEQDDRKTCLGGGVKPLSGGGGIFKSAAVAVLRMERKLMTTGDITRVALERGLIKCQGKTPEATMASALYTDVKRKHDKSVFTRPQEGLFGLREWIDEGFFPEGWEGPADGLGVAPFKKRATPSVKTHTARHTNARGTKSRASNAWRDASSDYDEDEEMLEDEEEEDMVETGGDEYEDEEEEPSPAPASTGRGRGRPPKKRSEGRESVDPDNLESPLHVLGHAAALSKSADEVAGGSAGSGGGSGKRKRRPSSIQVPDRPEGAMHSAPGSTGHATTTNADTMTPKSPYDDSLAALHEIATSPMSYATNGIIDMTSREPKRKPKLIVDVAGGSGQDDGHVTITLPSSMATPSSLLHALDTPGMPQLPDSTTGAVLVATGTGYAKPPLIALSIPALTSPHSFIEGLNTPGLLSLPLPDALPTTPDMLAAALAQSGGLHGLMSPGFFTGLTPRPGNGNKANGSMLPPSRPLNLGSSAAGLPPRPPPPRKEYGKLSADQVEAELAEISKVQGVVEKLEQKLGGSHPQVGKAWLSVARMYQSVGGSAEIGMVRAREVLARANAAFNACAEESKQPTKSEAEWQYLKDRLSGNGAAAVASGNGDLAGAGSDVPPAADASGNPSSALVAAAAAAMAAATAAAGAPAAPAGSMQGGKHQLAPKEEPMGAGGGLAAPEPAVEAAA